MVLNELGQSISRALATINQAETIDDKVLDACLKDICTALLQADINVKLVMNLRCGTNEVRSGVVWLWLCVSFLGQRVEAEAGTDIEWLLCGSFWGSGKHMDGCSCMSIPLSTAAAVVLLSFFMWSFTRSDKLRLQGISSRQRDHVCGGG